MKNIFLVSCVLAFLSACVTPVPKSVTVPHYPGSPPADTAVEVVDHRPYILNGDKEEWFEGIIWSFLGFPVTTQRLGEFEDKPFALYLATILKESIEGAGGKAEIVSVAKGTSHKDAVAALANQRADTGLLVMMYQSHIDFKVVKYQYAYRFELIVLDRTGQITFRKQFEGVEQESELKQQFPFDNMAAAYKKTFDKILADPEIKAALNAAR